MHDKLLEYNNVCCLLVHVCILQSQFAEVNDAELKEMEAQIANMTQTLKDSNETQRWLDAGSSLLVIMLCYDFLLKIKNL